MKKILLVPDSFKGTMSSREICSIMRREILRLEPSCRVVSIPAADGGEGTVDAFAEALGGEKKYLTVRGPMGAPVEGFYAVCGELAVVEMAAAAGLPLMNDALCVERASTYGVGELLCAAAREPGVKRLILGLGGSATNDGGCGAAAAMGVRFFRRGGESFVPAGGTLKDIARIDLSGVDPVLRQVELICMCDIDNPLCGEEGAAAMFAPQKGALPGGIPGLDRGLAHFAALVKETCGTDILTLPGAGAAGGMAGGMAGLFGAKLQPGIESVLDAAGFDDHLRDADLVLTGEGRIDGQSLRGKVVIGVARRASKCGVPVVAVVGDALPESDRAYEEGVTAIFTINRLAVPFSQAKEHCREDMAATVRALFRCMQALLSRSERHAP